MHGRFFHYAMAFAAGLLAVLSVGCSSGASLFGLSPPAHKLLPQTKDFHDVSPPPNAPRELNKTLLPPYIVEPSDVLLVQPVELDAPVRISADQPVQPDGTIDLGSFGRPVVAGKTVAVIEAEVNDLVRAKLKPGETATINVRLINRASKVYYVLGEVNAPGVFPISGRETALDAVLAAGGLTKKASRANIVLTRPTDACACRKVLPVCYSQIVQLGDTTTNYQILPGDRIYVPSQTMLEGSFLDKEEGLRPVPWSAVVVPDGEAGVRPRGLRRGSGPGSAMIPAYG